MPNLNDILSFVCHIVVPSRSPTSLLSIKCNSSSITIQWSEVDCFERNSVITGYQIKVNQITWNVTSDERQFTATKLFPNTMYELRVAAMSSNGTGPFKYIMGTTKPPNGIVIFIKFLHVHDCMVF